MLHVTRKYLKRLSISIFFGMSLYFVVLLLMFEDEHSFETFSSIGWQTYFLVVMFALGNYLFRFLRWLYFVAPMQVGISWKRHLLIYISGFALTTTPAKSGEMIRSVYLASLDVRYGKSLAAFFSERLLDVVAVLLLAFVFFFFAFEQYQKWMLLGGVLVLSIFILFRSELISKVLQKITKGKSKSVVLDFTQAVSNLLSNRSLLKALPLSLLAWLSQSLCLVVVVYALGFETNLFVLMGIYCVSILAGALTFIPGGIGATEAAMSLLLIALGMEASIAVLASVIVRAITVWFAVALGLLSMLILNKFL